MLYIVVYKLIGGHYEWSKVFKSERERDLWIAELADLNPLMQIIETYEREE